MTKRKRAALTLVGFQVRLLDELWDARSHAVNNVYGFHTALDDGVFTGDMSVVAGHNTNEEKTYLAASGFAEVGRLAGFLGCLRSVLGSLVTVELAAEANSFSSVMAAS